MIATAHLKKADQEAMDTLKAALGAKGVYEVPDDAALSAINRITAVLRDGPPLCRCSRCGARFEAYRRYRSHKWARQCRQCSDRNRIKTQALSSR